MDTKIIPERIVCSEHAGELIIRVSLDLNDKKLFFCHDCLENEKKENLIKFQDLVPTLQQQYKANLLVEMSKDLPDELKETF